MATHQHREPVKKAEAGVVSGNKTQQLLRDALLPCLLVHQFQFPTASTIVDASPALGLPPVASTTPPLSDQQELIDKWRGLIMNAKPAPSRAACHVPATPPSERAPERIFGFRWPGQCCTHETRVLIPCHVLDGCEGP